MHSLSRGCSTNTFVTYSLFNSFAPLTFSSKSSNHFHSQIVRARELKSLEKIHLPPPVTGHVSHDMCHMSCVTSRVSRDICHVSCVTWQYFFYSFLITSFSFYKVVKLVKGGSVINGATLSIFLTNCSMPNFPTHNKSQCLVLCTIFRIFS